MSTNEDSLTLTETTSEPRFQTIRAWALVAWGWAKKAPVTAGLVAMMWVVFIVSGMLSHNRLQTLGLGEHAHMFTLRVLTSGMTTSTLRGLIVCTIVALLFGWTAERKLGSGRYLLTALGSQAIGMPVGVAFGLAVTGFAARFSHTNLWGQELQTEKVLNPIAWVVGPLIITTAIMSTLWRRRIRTFLVVAAVSLVLYSGSLTDFILLTVVVLGIIAGQVFFDRTSAQVSWRMSVREQRVLIALIIGAVAISPVIAMINPHAAGPFSPLTNLIWQPAMSKAEIAGLCGTDVGLASPECAQAMAHARNNGVGPFMANIMPFIIQLIALIGLSRGRRISWWIVLGFQLGTIALLAWEMVELRENADPTVASLNFLAAVTPWIITTIVLLASAKLFHARSSQKATRTLLMGGAVTAAGTSALWLVGAWLLRNAFEPALSWGMIIKEWPLRYLPPPLAVTAGIDFQPTGAVGWGLLEWAGTIFWIVIAVLLYKVISAPRDDAELAARERAHGLLTAGTGDHLSWMTLWSGNRYWFTGDNYVAYRVKNNVALTLGGPVTTSDDKKLRSAVAREFEQFATSSGWVTAWYSVDKEFAQARSVDGFYTQQVAEESILDTTNPEFKGKKYQNIRTARNHAVKEGIQPVWTTWNEADPVLREKIIALSEEWVADKALPEMGFTLGTLEELRDPDTRLLLAVGEDGTLHGVTSWLPRYVNGHIDGLVLDFMRRNAAGFRPVIEYLISEAMVTAHAEGLEWISLSGAPLARSDDGPRNFLDQVLDKLGETMEPLYGFRSLAASKNKFQPEHHAWFLCYRDQLSLPSIGLAISAAYVPEIKAKDGIEAAKAWLASK